MSKQKKTKVNLDITQFVFLKDNLLVKALRPEAENGLVDPAQYEDKPEFGVIMSVSGKIEEENLKPGTVVRFGKYSTEMIRTNGEDYFIVREEDISSYLPQ